MIHKFFSHDVYDIIISYSKIKKNLIHENSILD